MSAAATGSIVRKFEAVRARIAQACRDSSRPNDVRVIAITKTHSRGIISAALAAGLSEFGENRVRDLVDKYEVAPEATWHFVGRLQTNKVVKLIGRDVLIHSVDRERLIDAIASTAKNRGAAQRILIQVNVGGDRAKGGCEPHRAPALVAYAQATPWIQVEGLMTVPPLAQAAEQADVSRRSFAGLRELRDEISSRWPSCTGLSMGMSGDFGVAVEEGATMVRLGTALLGPRSQAHNHEGDEQ